jgi:DtxR family Mn-dependent transcriptional regulator
MVSSSTVENYLKAIFQAQSTLPPADLVPMGQVASALGVVPGTATTMVKTLAESGLARYEPYAGVRLTAAGERLAALVLRRHRLIELFLVQVMGMSWTEVHEEAEHLEHAVSDRLIDRIDEMLGRPAVDPHGDPIPDSDGAVSLPHYESLLTCPMTTRVTIQRVSDQSPEFLRFIERNELRPGQVVEVRERDAAADSVLLTADRGRTCTIGARAASKVLVRAGALLLALMTSLLAPSATARAQSAPFRIADNSFLVEEAFNQEAGVVQNIGAAARIGGAWAATFTQEWPAPSERHQLSYTLAWQDGLTQFGLGDALVNYRYQLWTEGAGRPAFSPRASLVLPTGRVDSGRGLGSYGLQVNLPFSKQAGDIYWHWNAGLTWLPRAAAPGPVTPDGHTGLVSPFLAGSAIYRLRPMLHLMLEGVALFDESVDGIGTSRDRLLTLSPGVRGGWDVGSAQIITGVAAPVVWGGAGTEAGVFLYLSYELPFRQ